MARIFRLWGDGQILETENIEAANAYLRIRGVGLQARISLQLQHPDDTPPDEWLDAWAQVEAAIMATGSQLETRQPRGLEVHDLDNVV